MSMQDPLADMLTRIRNAQMVGKTEVTMPSSKLKVSVAQVLEQEGYVGVQTVSGDVKPQLTIALKYYEGKPVIENIERISKPSLRIFKAAKQVPNVRNGLGICIVSTSHGVMTDKEAREKNYGGEIICIVS